MVQHISGEGPVRFQEVTQRTRPDFQSGKMGGTEEDGEMQEYYQIHCLRRQWVYGPYVKAGPYYLDADAVRQPRQCMYFMDYQPGFGPEEHKELKREWDNRKAIRNAALIGTGIGALAAIIAQILYVIITE